MFVISNEKLIKTRTTWSGRLMLAGFGLILGSAVLTFLNPTTPAFIVPAYAALFGGFIIFNIGASSGAKWRMLPRADQALAKALKGLDQRYRLYNFLLPAEHVLLTPAGIAVFQVRRLAGTISCTGDRWYQRKSILSRLRFAAEEQLGNPAKDLERDLAAMRTLLDAHLEGDPIPLEGLIFFPNPNAQLTINGTTIPVLTAKDIKNSIRQGTAQRARLDTDTYNALADLFDEVEGGEQVDVANDPDPAPEAKAKARKGK